MSRVLHIMSQLENSLSRQSISILELTIKLKMNKKKYMKTQKANHKRNKSCKEKTYRMHKNPKLNTSNCSYATVKP